MNFASITKKIFNNGIATAISFKRFSHCREATTITVEILFQHSRVTVWHKTKFHKHLS